MCKIFVLTRSGASCRHAEVMIMKAWMIDFTKAVFWALVIVAIVLFSTGDYQTFIYQNF
jgi:hypothetical protein